MDKDALKLYSDIIDKLYDMQDEFFYNQNKIIFRLIRGLRRRKDQNFIPNNFVLIHQVAKTIDTIDMILSLECLNVEFIDPLNEMKEQLESIEIMIELNC